MVEETVRRANIPAKLAAAERIEGWPATRVRAWQRVRLAQQVEALRATPWGAERVPRGAEFTDLPPLDRDELRLAGDRLRTLAAAPVIERRTSGSTGRPVVVWHGAQTVGYSAAARLRHLAWHGLPARELTQADVNLAMRVEEPDAVRVEGNLPRWQINPLALVPESIRSVHEAIVAAGGAVLRGGVTIMLDRWAEA
jgi:hypothetical protein